MGKRARERQFATWVPQETCVIFIPHYNLEPITPIDHTVCGGLNWRLPRGKTKQRGNIGLLVTNRFLSITAQNIVVSIQIKTPDDALVEVGDRLADQRQVQPLYEVIVLIPQTPRMEEWSPLRAGW
jgi:hypothetical protein